MRIRLVAFVVFAAHAVLTTACLPPSGTDAGPPDDDDEDGGAVARLDAGDVPDADSGPGDGGPGDGGAGTDAGPLPFGLVLDTSRTLTLAVTPEAQANGTITLADGTSLGIYLGAGSVGAPVEVRATPIVSMDLPVGTHAAGLWLEPTGLALRRPAQIDVTILSATDLQDVLAYDGKADGTIKYQRPPYYESMVDHDGDVTTPSLFQTRTRFFTSGFSAHGAANNADPAAAAAANPATTSADALDDALIEAFALDGTFDADAAGAALSDYFEANVRPKLVAAASDHLAFFDAMTTYNDWFSRLKNMIEHYGVPALGIDPLELDTLLIAAIRYSFDFYNQRCMADASVDDAELAMDVWLWARALGADHDELAEDLVREDLCVRLVIEQTDMAATLQSDAPNPLRIRAGLEIAGLTPATHDAVLVVKQVYVQGGTLAATSFDTDGQGDARTTGTLSANSNGMTISLMVEHPLLFLVEEPVQLFRPSQRAQDDDLLLAGSWSGTATNYYVCGEQGCSPCDGWPAADLTQCNGTYTCASVGTIDITLDITGDPFGYVAQYEQNGGETGMEFRGEGGPSSMSGQQYIGGVAQQSYVLQLGRVDATATGTITAHCSHSDLAVSRP